MKYFDKLPLFILLGRTKIEIPQMRAMFDSMDPTAFPTESAYSPFADAIVETINSGMVVASATIVAPTITWGNLSFFARLDEAVTK